MQGISREPVLSAELTKKPYRIHYAWVVAAITFFTILNSAGTRATPGVLIVPLEQHFHWSRAVISFAIAINLLLYGLCGPFTAAFIERYGARRIMLVSSAMLALATCLSIWMRTPWQFILTWGLITGLGVGMASSVLGASVANRWFKERKGLVIGLLTASLATGQLVFLPVLAKAVEVSGWQAAVWITTASALLITVTIFLFMRDKPSDIGLLPYGASTHFDPPVSNNPLKSVFNGLINAVKVKEFWFLSCGFFVSGASTTGLIGTHFVSAAIEKGMSEVTAASLLALMGAFNIAGTTLSGWLSDRYENHRLLFWYYSLRGVSLLFLPLVFGTGYIIFGLFILFYGLDWLAAAPPTIKLSAKAFGSAGGVVYGWIFAVHQLGAATAAFGAGVLHTWTGNYTAAFIIAGVLCLLISALFINISRAARTS